ncbi:iron complex outermembrane receptor protein [Novosphingobium sp. PhB57]|uniref:TonB-dependent siderophore receptor n=1 Tax=Novosphingobium sp. PhB57 TaxID=2485107 RepID=UPI001049B633|nr:TonB-dependent siderophore receptor [Novosphingobium sp. PhB57]TCU57965.1 iron complex outermembrane receptor protein [Novosphingobium sp. PhB57]
MNGRSEGIYGISTASTGMKIDVPVLKTPQSITAISNAVILEQSAETLTDVLRNVSGITEANSFGNTGDNFMIRGFESGQGSVLRDGYLSVQVRALNASTERVEVLKGPASLLYGRFEPGGLVNVVTKKPLDSFHYNISANASTRGQSRQMADVTGPLGGGFAFRLIGEREDSDYWRPHGHDIERTFVAPSLSWSGHGFSLLATYEYTDSTQPFDRGRVYYNGKRLDTPATRYFGEAFTTLKQRLHSGNVLLGYVFAPGWRMEAKYAIQRTSGSDLQVRPRSLVVGADGEATGELIRSLDGNRDLHDNRDYLSLNLHGDVQMLGMRHKLLFGADYETYESLRGFQVDSPRRGGFNIYDPVYGLLDQNLAELTVTPNSATVDRYRTAGLYVQDLVMLDDAWTLVLGGRYETFRDFTQSGSNVSDRSKTDTFLPRLGLVFQPRPNMSVYASYSRAFAPNPSVPAEGSQPASGPFPPERSRSYEVGLKAELFSGVTTTLAVYDIRKNNVLETVDIGDGNTITEARDKVTSRGVEFDLAGEITRRLSVILSYAYTDAQDPQSTFQDNVVNVARHTGSLALSYRPGGALDGLSLGGGAYRVARRYGGLSQAPNGSTSVPFFLDGYTTFDLNAGYAFEVASGHSAYARMTLRNLTNRNYDQSAGNALRVVPGQARTLFATIGMRM